jgi:hypothetical protein
MSEQHARRERRPVADQLLLMFGAIAGLLLLFSVVLLALVFLFRPEADVSGLTRMLDTQISIIIGATLGWAARSGLGSTSEQQSL